MSVCGNSRSLRVIRGISGVWFAKLYSVRYSSSIEVATYAEPLESLRLRLALTQLNHFHSRLVWHAPFIPFLRLCARANEPGAGS